MERRIETSEELTKLGLVHGVTTRLGGVSKAPFYSLNLAYHVGDKAQDVEENRRRLCQWLQMPFDKLTACCQTHGDHIAIVTEKEAGRGNRSHESALPDTDGLITNCPNIPLLICIADCVPILLYEPEVKAVAVLHSGWKGTALNIGGKGVWLLQERFGADRKKIRAYIGTAITAPYFQVGPEVVEQLASALGEAEPSTWVTEKEGTPYVDLYEVNKKLLSYAGIPENQIEVSKYSAYKDEHLYYSYRRDHGKTGRMAAFAMIK